MATTYSRGGRNTADSETVKFYQNEESSNAEKNQLYQNPFFSNQIEQKQIDSDEGEYNQNEDINEDFDYNLRMNDLKKENELSKQQEIKAFKFAEAPINNVSEEKEKIDQPFLEPNQQRFVGPIRYVEESTYHQKDEKPILTNKKIERSIFSSEKKEERRVEFTENKFVEAITYNPNSMEKREVAVEELDKLRNSSVLFKNLGPQEVEMVYKMKSLKIGSQIGIKDLRFSTIKKNDIEFYKVLEEKGFTLKENLKDEAKILLFMIEKHRKFQKDYDEKVEKLSNKKHTLKEIIQNVFKKRHFLGEKLKFELNFFRQTLDEFVDLQKEAEISQAIFTVLSEGGEENQEFSNVDVHSFAVDKYNTYNLNLKNLDTKMQEYKRFYRIDKGSDEFYKKLQAVLAVLKEGEEFYRSTRNSIFLLNNELRKRTKLTIGVLNDNIDIFQKFFQEIEESHDVAYKIIYIRNEKLSVLNDRIQECKRDLSNLTFDEKSLTFSQIKKEISAKKKADFLNIEYNLKKVNIVLSDLTVLKREVKILRDDAKCQYYLTIRLKQAAKVLQEISESRAICYGLLQLWQFLDENFYQDMEEIESLFEQSHKLQIEPDNGILKGTIRSIGLKMKEKEEKLKEYCEMEEFTGIKTFLNSKINLLEPEIQKLLFSKENVLKRSIIMNEGDILEFFTCLENSIKKREFDENELSFKNLLLRQILAKNNINIFDNLLSNLDDVFHYLERVKLENDEDSEIVKNLIVFLGHVNEEIKKGKVKYCSSETITYFGKLFDFFAEIKGLFKNPTEMKNTSQIIKKYSLLDKTLLAAIQKKIEKINKNMETQDLEKKVEELKKNESWLSEEKIKKLAELKKNPKANEIYAADLQKIINSIEAFFMDPEKNSIFSGHYVIYKSVSNLNEIFSNKKDIKCLIRCIHNIQLLKQTMENDDTNAKKQQNFSQTKQIIENTVRDIKNQDYKLLVETHVNEKLTELQDSISKNH